MTARSKGPLWRPKRSATRRFHAARDPVRDASPRAHRFDNAWRFVALRRRPAPRDPADREHQLAPHCPPPGAVNQKVLPQSGSLHTDLAAHRHEVTASPAEPYASIAARRRGVAWVKAPAMRSSSRAMPMPVSRTEQRSVTVRGADDRVPRPGRADAVGDLTAPVNLSVRCRSGSPGAARRVAGECPEASARNTPRKARHQRSETRPLACHSRYVARPGDGEHARHLSLA
jgi:hypothetical protein